MTKTSAYARITDEAGDFNETAAVEDAGPLVAYGLLTYDGEATPGEHCYTVVAANVPRVREYLATAERLRRERAAEPIPQPGWYGEPPAGVSWSRWLAMHNVD